MCLNELTIQEDVIETKYSIQLVSKLSGVGVHTIRAWEKRYQAVVPSRSDSGRREYNDTDLEKLVLLNQLCTLGHSIGKIANNEIPVLKEMLEKLGKVEDKTEKTETVELDYNLENSLSNMILGISAYKLDIVDHELNKIKLLTNTREIVVKILVPLLQKVGSLIQRRELTLSQEIAFHSLLKFHLGEIIFKSRKKNQSLEKIIIATPEGCFEEIPLLLSTLLMISKNFEIIYLGTNVQAGALLEATKATDASAVLLYLGPHSELDSASYYKKFIQFLDKKLEGDTRLYALKSHKIDQIESSFSKTHLVDNLRELDKKVVL